MIYILGSFGHTLQTQCIIKIVDVTLILCVMEIWLNHTAIPYLSLDLDLEMDGLVCLLTNPNIYKLLVVDLMWAKSSLLSAILTHEKDVLL